MGATSFENVTSFCVALASAPKAANADPAIKIDIDTAPLASPLLISCLPGITFTTLSIAYLISQY
jgi:hypothetical protein